jgi:hypothetical protein
MTLNLIEYSVSSTTYGIQLIYIIRSDYNIYGSRLASNGYVTIYTPTDYFIELTDISSYVHRPAYYSGVTLENCVRLELCIVRMNIVPFFSTNTFFATLDDEYLHREDT